MMATLDSMYCKIRDISVNGPNRPIKVFVSKKYGPEVSGKGNKYLKLILEDDSGQIQAMIYDNVEKQNEIFQLNKGRGYVFQHGNSIKGCRIENVYYLNDANDRKCYIIQDATVKETNQTFKTYGHDYELIITRSTKVKQCDMPATRPEIYTPIKELHHHIQDEDINIIGQVEEVGELQAHDTRIKDNTPHREVMIKDESGSEIVSLWGDKAEKNIKPGDVILISPVKLGLYKGELSVQSRYNSSMMINPAIPEADKLREMNILPDKPTGIISDSDSDSSDIGTPKRKKRKVISSSSEKSESEFKLEPSKNLPDNFLNLPERKMQQKPKKVKKNSTVITVNSSDDSSDEEIPDVSLSDDQTQETIASDSDGSDDDETTITKQNAKRLTNRKLKKDSLGICSNVPKKTRKRLFMEDSDNSSAGDETPTSDKSNDNVINTKCEAASSFSSSQGTSSDHDSLTDDDTDDGDNTEEDNQNDNGPTNFDENTQAKVTSFVYWTVYDDIDERTKQYAVSLQREIESKMEACISQAWNQNTQKALEKCPVFATTERGRSEIKTLRDCEVCHRNNHPWKYFVTLSGIPYNRRTMEEREDEDEEKFEYFMGNYCYNRTKLYHKLYHYQYKLYQECQRKINKLGNKPDKLFKNEAFLNKQYRTVTKMFKDVEMEVCEDGHSTRPGTRFKRDFFGKRGAYGKW